MVCGQIKIGPFGPVSGYEDRWLKQGKIRAFHTICTGKGSVYKETSSPIPPLHRKHSSETKTSMHPSKALFSLDPYNLQLHCFLGAGTIVLFVQPCKALQMVQAAPNTIGKAPKSELSSVNTGFYILSVSRINNNIYIGA